MTAQTAATVVASQQFSVASPFRYAFIAVSVIIVGWYWLSPPFRAAARRGGWRLAIALLSSLSMLVFGIGIAMGQLVIVIVATTVGAPASWFLLIRFIRGKPQPSE